MKLTYDEKNYLNEMTDELKNEFEIDYIEFDFKDDKDNYNKFKIVFNRYELNENDLIKFIELNLMNFNININIHYDDYFNDELNIELINRIFNHDYQIDSFIQLYLKLKKLYDNIKIIEINENTMTLKFNEIDIENVKMNIKYFFNIDIEIYENMIII